MSAVLCRDVQSFLPDQLLLLPCARAAEHPHVPVLRDFSRVALPWVGFSSGTAKAVPYACLSWEFVGWM